MRKTFTLILLLTSSIFAVIGQTAEPALSPSTRTDIPLFSFGVFADCQYCECPTAGTRFYKESKEKLRDAVKTFNARSLSFVVSLGDIINSDLASYDTLTPIIRTLKHPFYFVYGNHDFLRDKEIDKALLAQWNLSKRYYSFKRTGWRFITLDSNDISISSAPQGSEQWQEANTYLEKLKAQKAGNANNYNGAISEPQIKWLRQELAEASQKNEKVVILNHMPIIPQEASINLWNDKELEKILRNSPQVVAYFCGHHHLGNYTVADDIQHLNFKGMVETEETAYAIIHVYESRLEVEGYGREESRTLTLMPRSYKISE